MHNFYRYKFIPQNYLAEEILLGIILIYPKIINKIKNLIPEDIFFIESNKIIYSRLIDIIKKKNGNVIGLLYELDHTNLLNKIGGIKHVIKLMKKSQIFISSYQTNTYLEHLINLLKKYYIKRLIIQLGYNIIKIGHVINIDNTYLYKKITSYIETIKPKIQENKTNKIISIKELISIKLLGIKYKQIKKQNTERNKKITSGFLHLDSIIQGLPNGNLIIIAGRPSIGKTSLTINIAYHCFFKEKISLLVFSLEMSSTQIFNKFISIGSKTNIEQESINTMNNENWEKISKICHTLLQQNVYINEETNLNINQIELIAHSLKKHQFIELIIIDYLQLIELATTYKKKQNRSQEIGYVTRRLKLLAQYLKIPIIVISQLNRNIENRHDKEPLLSDLKESGCIIYSDNINIKSEYLNKINIKNRNINKILIKQTNKILTSNKNKIDILNKYIFIYADEKNKIGLTYNHKFLNKNIWIKSNQSLKTTTIFNITKNQTILRKYLNNINFDKYSKIYDIGKKHYFSLILKEVVIHNSIEQDADIIMILYETQNIKNSDYQQNDKIIDLKVSKNRNGNTGYCRLAFEPYTNIFKDIY